MAVPAAFSDSPSAIAAERNATHGASWFSDDLNDAEPAASGAGSKTDSPSSGASTAAPDTTTGDEGQVDDEAKPTADPVVPQQPDKSSAADAISGDEATSEDDEATSEDQAQPHTTQEPVRP